jgi:hypothetical protein
VTVQPGERHDRPAPRRPVPTIRAVVRVAPIDRATARGRAAVPGAIDPRLRSAPPYVPPPPRPRERPARVTAVAQAPEPVAQAPKAVVQQTTAPSEPAPAPNPEVPPTPRKPRNRARRALLPLAAALLAAFVGGTGYLMIREPAAPGRAGRFAGPAVSTDAAPFAVAADGAADPFGTRAPALTGAPTRLKVDAIDLDTPLETLRLGADGALTPPRDFAKAGWYAGGTRPGDVGPAVIAGHVDSRRGPAVFYDLRKLTRGDRIEVVRGGRALAFTVVATAWYPKNSFPTDEVYGPTPDRQLRLITCGGVFDRSLRSYKDNLVVYAVAG